MFTKLSFPACDHTRFGMQSKYNEQHTAFVDSEPIDDSQTRQIRNNHLTYLTVAMLHGSRSLNKPASSFPHRPNLFLNKTAYTPMTCAINV